MSVWLCQIAKHMYFDYLKREKHIQKIEIENLEIFDTEKNVEETYLVRKEIQEL